MRLLSLCSITLSHPSPFQRQALACDEVDLSPEEYKKKVAEFNLAAQQQDVMVKLAVGGQILPAPPPLILPHTSLSPSTSSKRGP